MADIQVPMLNLSDVAQQPENVANMQLTQNQSGLVAQQAQGLNLANQRAAIGLQLFKNALGDFSGQPIHGVQDDGSAPAGAPAAGSDNAASDDSGTAAAPSAGPAAGAQQGTNADQSGEINSIFPESGAAGGLRQFFAVNPAGNARSQQMLLEAAMSGDPGLLAYAKQQRDLQVSTDTFSSQQRAQSLFDTMTTVSSAPKGAALATLARIAPDIAAKIEKAYPDDPADQDMAARESGAHIAATVHQWTGRPIVAGPDGVYRDTATGQRIPVPVVGLSQQGYANLSAKGEALVSVPNSDGTSTQMPLWKANKAPSLSAWVQTQANRGQAQIDPSVAPKVGLMSALVRANGPGSQSAPGAGAQPAPQPQQQPAQTPEQQAYVAQMRKALSDPEYRIQQAPVVAGQSQSPADLAQTQQTVKSRAQLMQDAQSATQAAAQSLTYLRAAQQIMASKGTKPVTGLFGPVVHQISRVWGGVNATNYQEVAKYLSNAALQNARATYGARMTQSEVQLQLNEMNPSTHMTDDAINSLVGENVRNALYSLQSAKRVRPYLMQGNDPQSYSEWNQQYFPQQDIVNTPTKTSNASGTGAAPRAPQNGQAGVSRSGRPIVFRNGQWVYK